MAVLRQILPGHSRPRFRGKARALLALLAGLWFTPAPAQSAAFDEYHVKAVFLFNFTLFTQWPASAFAAPDTPLVIGVLGDDPFGPHLDNVVRGEKVNDHPVLVRRFRRPEEAVGCHVVFIGRSESSRLDQVFSVLARLPVLTVGEMDEFATRGGMIRFVTERNKTRLRINVGATRAAGLTLSSKLLRPAELVGEIKE